MESRNNTVVLRSDEQDLEKGLNKGYSLSWDNISYKVKDKEILKNVSGILEPGSLLAVIGASGSGKSSFIDILAGRRSGAQISGNVLVNGKKVSMKHVSRYCTQEDALFGNLTVRETLMYAARFNLPQNTKVEVISHSVDEIISEFGLSSVEHTIVGTPLLKGCSGGQVRRVSTASQIVGMESGIIFLDEPTSGLDSVAAYSVIEAVKKRALQKKVPVIATIHQPSTTTFNLFTHILILAQGQTVYFGEREGAIKYFEDIGKPVPLHYNPCDMYLQWTNTDFSDNKELGQENLDSLIMSFKNSNEMKEVLQRIAHTKRLIEQPTEDSYKNGFLHQTKILTHRGFLNAAKNPIAYWVRVIMYAALAFMIGSTWLRMGLDQSKVIDRMVAINFSVAFLAFMTVAGIPAFLEERHVFLRERGNGLYGVEAYLVSNLLVSLPFLAIIALSFSVVGYFLMGLQQFADRFFVFLGYLFTMLLVAEAQVQFISVLVPIFVAALTISAFLNGAWMVVNGFALIKISDIPAGWRFTLHYIDFQKYAFEALLKNEMTGLVFNCASPQTAGGQCACSVPSALNAVCKFNGQDVLKYYERDNVTYGAWLGYLLAIWAFFKIATYIVLKVRGVKSK